MKRELSWAAQGVIDSDTIGLWGEGVTAFVFTKSMDRYLAAGQQQAKRA